MSFPSSGRQHNIPALPAILHDPQVLTFRQWCALNNFSARTGRRIFQSGAGPIITQLSAQRAGITVANNRAWQASRERRHFGADEKA
jgi:hypothetical protein